MPMNTRFWFFQKTEQYVNPDSDLIISDNNQSFAFFFRYYLPTNKYLLGPSLPALHIEIHSSQCNLMDGNLLISIHTFTYVNWL